MSRHEADFSPPAEHPRDATRLSPADLPRALAPAGGRQDVIIRYLAAAEDWQEAARLLGGAFAPVPRDATGLKGGKAE